MMHPYKNRLLIEPIESKAVLVSAENKFQQMGVIRGLGYRPWYKFWQGRFFKLGDIVVFNTWGADKADINDKEYWFILEHPDFILARFDQDDVG